MAQLIVFTAIVILICLALSKIFLRIGMPALLAFILLGMLFGVEGIFKIPFQNYQMAEHICSFALIFIMFYGGFGTKYETAKPVAPQAVILSSFGTLGTAAITGIFCYYGLEMDFWVSMLIGAVISSTDAASVFSILRSKKMNLRGGTAPMLEIESGSNDPFAYMLTVIILNVMGGELSGPSLVYIIGAQVVFGLVVGVAISQATARILKKLGRVKGGVDTLMVFSCALLSYGIAEIIGGNGYLSVYIAGILLGNKQFYNKTVIVNFFDGITAMMQILIFFLLGLLVIPSQLLPIAPSAFAIAIFITFVARPVMVFVILTPFGADWRQKLLVSWAGIRGAASIVFAIMVVVSPAYLSHDVYNIVFFIALFSIGFQGALIPFVSKWLKMIDDNENVMRTFNDYSEDLPIEFVEIKLKEGHSWIGKRICDIDMLDQLVIALIVRGDTHMTPVGDTKLIRGDVLVFTAFKLSSEIGGYLYETHIDRYHPWLNKPVSQIGLDKNKIMVLIKRGEEIVIPKGDTMLLSGDECVISQN